MGSNSGKSVPSDSHLKTNKYSSPIMFAIEFSCVKLKVIMNIVNALPNCCLYVQSQK